MSQYIYQFYNKDNDCIYVGKTGRLSSRFSQHKRDKYWFDEVEYIQYAKVPEDFMVDIYELYYINKIHPKYNRKDIKINHIDFCYDELKFKEYKNFKKENYMNIKRLGHMKLPYKMGEDKDVYFFGIEESPKKVTKNVVNHNILLVDCSGSMSREIENLKKEITKVVDSLLFVENSFVSIITYSGHKESKVVVSAVKCEESSYQMNKVYEHIDKDIFVQDVTVISEPLEKSIDICKSLVGVCDKNNIMLFTDGYLVPTMWSTSKERSLCEELTKDIGNSGYIINSIGFGQNYDRQLLKEMSKNGHGDVYHMDEIDDYKSIIMYAVNKELNSAFKSYKVESNDGVFDLADGSFGKEINSFNKNPVFASYSKDVIVDGNNINLFDEDVKLEDSNREDYLYCLARYFMQEEDIDNYEYIVKNIGDVFLYESTRNCYSFTEKGRCLNIINDTLAHKDKRFLEGKKKYENDFEDDDICVLEMIKDIILDDNSELYWDSNIDYHRINVQKKSVEDNVKFIRNENTLNPVKNISLGNNCMNINILVQIDGVVRDSVSGFSHDAHIFRSYNIINGGNVNVHCLTANISDNLLMLERYKELRKKGILYPSNYQNSLSGNLYSIDLTKMKSANKRILKSMSGKEIIDALNRSQELYCKQWAYNKKIKEIMKDNGLDNVNNDKFSTAENEIRKILRIDENELYTPVSVTDSEDKNFDVYPAYNMTWSVKFSEKKAKDEFWEQVKDCTLDDLKYLSDELKKIRQEKREIDTKVNMVRIASGIIGKSPFMFDSVVEKEKNVKDKHIESMSVASGFSGNAIVGGKVTESRKIVDKSIMIQQSWMQLVPCN